MAFPKLVWKLKSVNACPRYSTLVVTTPTNSIFSIPYKFLLKMSRKTPLYGTFFVHRRNQFSVSKDKKKLSFLDSAIHHKSTKFVPSDITKRIFEEKPNTGYRWMITCLVGSWWNEQTYSNQRSKSHITKSLMNN
jgi:hypothetical protein